MDSSTQTTDGDIKPTHTKNFYIYIALYLSSGIVGKLGSGNVSSKSSQ
jgi:hypothetical protein